MSRSPSRRVSVVRGAAASDDAPRVTDAKERMVRSAMYVLAREGYQGASFTRVLEHSGAPRGSIYYHFPGGKDQLVAAAVEATLARGLAELDKARGKPLAALLRAMSTYWRDILERSECTSGCPVIAVSVGATNPDLRGVVATVLTRWRAGYRSALEGSGVPSARAGELAALLLSGFEGAMHLARAERSLQVFDDASRALRRAVVERATS